MFKPIRKFKERWPLVFPVGVAAAIVVSVVAGATAVATPVGTVDYSDVSNEVILQAQGRDIQGNINVGQPVKFGAKLVGGRPITLNTLVFAKRSPTNQNQDFGHQTNYSLGVNQQTFEATTTFSTTGTYRVWVAYNRNGSWFDFPELTINVVNPPPTTTAPPTTEPPTNPQPQGPGGTWNLTFFDEFNDTTVDFNKWRGSSSALADNGRGNKGNQQLEYNLDRNCSEANGRLTITAVRENFTSPSGTNYNWTSCLLSSHATYNFQYGFIEARMQLPAPRGFWPAFWTWQSPGVNQHNETDVFEFYSDNHDRLYATKHPNGGGCDLVNGQDFFFDPTAGFHTYGANIKPNGVDFYYDGDLVCQVGQGSATNTAIMVDQYVYSIIPPLSGTNSAQTHVDYVRAWQ